VPRPRGWLNHRFLCDGKVAVHDTWFDQGYDTAVVYDHKTLQRLAVLDWCEMHASRGYLLHPSGAVLFKQQAHTQKFRDQWHV